MLTPKWLLKLKERQILKAYLKRADKQEIDDRVNYYNQLEHVVEDIRKRKYTIGMMSVYSISVIYTLEQISIAKV